MARNQSQILNRFNQPGRVLRDYFSRLLDSQRMPESLIIFLTALLIGIGAGLGVVVFRWLIDTFQELFYGQLGGLNS